MVVITVQTVGHYYIPASSVPAIRPPVEQRIAQGRNQAENLYMNFIRYLIRDAVSITDPWRGKSNH